MKLKDFQTVQIYPSKVLANASVPEKKSSNGFKVRKYNSVFVEVVTDTNLSNVVCEYIVSSLSRCSDIKSVSHIFINCKPHSSVSPSSSITNVRGNISTDSKLQYLLIYINSKVRYIIKRDDNKLLEYSSLRAPVKVIIDKLAKQLS